MRTVVVLLGCVVVLAGCVGAPSPSPSPSPSVSPGSGGSASPVASPSVLPSVSPSPAVSPTPTPTSFPSYPADLPTQDPETAAIIHGWQEYWRVFEKFAADPLVYTDFTEVNSVTTGESSRDTLYTLESLREQRIRSEGGRVFRDVTIERVGADEAKLAYCMDANQLKVFEIDSGKRVARSGTLVEHVTMTRGKSGIWRVSQVRNEWAEC